MKYIRQLGIVVMVIGASCMWASSAEGAYGSAQSGLLPTTTPFTQCPAVEYDASCTDLIVITNEHPGGVILRDPEVGFYDDTDDVLVGVQNESSSPISSLKLGVPDDGDGSFAFDGDGLCGEHAPPTPSECPFAPSATEQLLVGTDLSNGWGYWGPDAELTPNAGEEDADAGTVTFPEPLQPGQYTYFTLEAEITATVYAGGSDLIETSLAGAGSEAGPHIKAASPESVTDTATLIGAHASEAEKGKKVTYRLYSDSACTKEINTKGEPVKSTKEPAGGEKTIVTTGELPKSTAVGEKLATNAVYYWTAEYEGDSHGNEKVIEPCGDETMSFGTPPSRAGATVLTTLKGGSASGASITVDTGTSVTDTASATVGGAAQGGRVTYYVYQDAGCTQQVSGARLGSAASTSGAYGPSSPVTLPVGTYYFQAIYSGSGSVAPALSACGSEVLNVVTPPPPCACASVKTYLNKFSVFGKDSTRLGMRLNIALTCTGGSGNGCASEVVIHAPAGAKFIDTAKGAKPTDVVTIHCAGPCSGTTIKRVSLTWLALKTTKKKKGKKTITTTTPIKSFLPHGRAKKSKVITIEMLCDTSGGVVKTVAKMTVHFDKHGQVDYKLSDLNGDGKLDGKQLNEF
jgi:hypothetical protein